MTLVSHTHVPDEVYEQGRKHFSEKELLDLTIAVVAINSWNRLAISLRAIPGTYQPKKSSGRRREESRKWVDGISKKGWDMKQIPQTRRSLLLPEPTHAKKRGLLRLD